MRKQEQYLKIEEAVLRMNRCFELLNHKIDRLTELAQNQELQQQNAQKLAQIGQQMESISGRVESIDSGVESASGRMESIDSRVKRIDRNVDSLNYKEDWAQTKLDASLDKLGALQQTMAQVMEGYSSIHAELKNQNRMYYKNQRSGLESVGQTAGEKSRADIHIYIVTYKKNDVLNKNIASLYQNACDTTEFDVTILANHPDIRLETENQHDNLRIVYNTTRSMDAWGNLSKDWNWCMLDAFERWDNPPQTKYCILCQNDVEWAENWQENLRQCKDFDFISQPLGDQLLVVTIEALKKVGFFDERFTTLHYHEEDYFLRTALKLGARASINGAKNHNGSYMSTSYHPLGENLISKTAFSGINLFDENLHTPKTHDALQKMFLAKWKIPKKLEEIKDRSELISLVRENHAAEPKEINWYPFFWDGYPKIEDTFAFTD